MQRIAVLIDADNVAAAYAPRISQFVYRLGKPIIWRAFGMPSAMTDWQRAGRSMLCEMRLQNSVANGKNGTDIALALDAMDILYTQGADAFCVVSNDRDFVPLAIRLRASGKLVHAICRHADERYRKAFDNVWELEPAELPIVAAFRMVSEGRPDMSLGEAGKLLRQQLPGVIPTTGKAPLRKALEAAGEFDLTGTGAAIRVTLKAKAS